MKIWGPYLSRNGTMMIEISTGGKRMFKTWVAELCLLHELGRTQLVIHKNGNEDDFDLSNLKIVNKLQRATMIRWQHHELINDKDLPGIELSNFKLPNPIIINNHNDKLIEFAEKAKIKIEFRNEQSQDIVDRKLGGADKISFERANNVKREKYILQDSRRVDRKRGFENDLTPDFVVDQISKGCYYCGDIESRMLLDRVDNNKGHTMNNVNPCCYSCNDIRGSMPYEAWIFLVPFIKDAKANGLFGNWNGPSTNRFSKSKPIKLPEITNIEHVKCGKAQKLSNGLYECKTCKRALPIKMFSNGSNIVNCLECIEKGRNEKRKNENTLIEQGFTLDYKDIESTYERQCAKEKYERQNGIEREKYILWRTKDSDQERGLDNDLTKEFIKEQIAKGCFYCGETEIKMTLDRIDNDRGHMMDNVNPSCIRCNEMRNSMPYQAWIFLAPHVKAAKELGLFGDWIGPKTPKRK